MPDRFQVYAETIDDENKLFYCTDDILMTPDSNGRVLIQLNTNTRMCRHSRLESHRRYKAVIAAKNEAGRTNSTGDIYFSKPICVFCMHTYLLETPVI